MSVHSETEHRLDAESRLKAWATGRDFDEAAALESLQSTLQETKDKVVRLWAGVELQHQLKNVTDTHEANIAKLRAVEKRIDELNSLQMALKAVKQQMDNALLHKEKNEEIMQRLKAETDKCKQMQVAKEMSVAAVKKELDKAADWCRSRFALQLKKVSGGRLQLVFTRIDYKDQAKPFYFSVKVNEDKSYSVFDCVPLITDLDDLVKKLNDTNNFRSFVIVVRQRFKVMT
ncbi:hypothetical protein NP493_591g02001 [Ridgeia piscesae]|uniref:Kinetochore protein SPC25 n=1 Tax=Ridgeia piscesae TaxID=27915 RepID=A0AAD9KUI5_RIDPI|nr:hypothetical protein NP493_591g02001 [Ridgeia piscesae]